MDVDAGDATAATKSTDSSEVVVEDGMSKNSTANILGASCSTREFLGTITNALDLSETRPRLPSTDFRPRIDSSVDLGVELDLVSLHQLSDYRQHSGQSMHTQSPGMHRSTTPRLDPLASTFEYDEFLSLRQARLQKLFKEDWKTELKEEPEQAWR